MKSKWGEEEKETIDSIKNINYNGRILNVAAGDGRFNNLLLEKASEVVAIDLDEKDLDILVNNTPMGLRDKLKIEIVDITKKFPYTDDSFDGVFCTGSLHLFEKKEIIKILNEIKRVLKPKGKIVIDFATDIKRYDRNGNEVVFSGEGLYSMDEAINFLKEKLKCFSLDIVKSTFEEECSEDSTGYKFIKGNFIVLSCIKYRV